MGMISKGASYWKSPLGYVAFSIKSPWVCLSRPQTSSSRFQPVTMWSFRDNPMTQKESCIDTTPVQSSSFFLFRTFCAPLGPRMCQEPMTFRRKTNKRPPLINRTRPSREGVYRAMASEGVDWAVLTVRDGLSVLEWPSATASTVPADSCRFDERVEAMEPAEEIRGHGSKKKRLTWWILSHQSLVCVPQTTTGTYLTWQPIAHFPGNRYTDQGYLLYGIVDKLEAKKQRGVLSPKNIHGTLAGEFTWNLAATSVESPSFSFKLTKRTPPKRRSLCWAWHLRRDRGISEDGNPIF